MKDDIYERAKTVKKICETIWSLDYYKNITSEILLN